MEVKIRLKQARLNHFLNLLNADLDNMTDEDKYSLGARFRFSSPMSVFGKHQTGEAHWKSIIKMLPQVQQLFKRTIEKLMKLREGKPLPLPPLKRLIELRDGHFKILYESATQMISYGVAPLEDQLEFDIAELGELLDGVPQTAFRTCRNPKCKKLFLQISKKPKLYCSISCAFKFLSKEHRNRMKKKKAA